jgi:hypothetical protein
MAMAAIITRRLAMMRYDGDATRLLARTSCSIRPS